MKTQLKSLFPNTDFSYLWGFHLLSLLGSEMTRFALPIWIYQQTENLVSFSIFICFGILSRILFSPIAGGIIDCINQKRILFISAWSLLALSLILLMILLSVLPNNFYLICILIFFIGFFSNFIHIATLSALPKLLDSNHLLSGNSLMITAESVALIFSPVVAGFLFYTHGISLVVIFDIALFLLSLAFISRIKWPETPLDTTKITWSAFIREIIKNLKTCIDFIKKSKTLTHLLVIISLINFIFSFSFIAFTPMVLNSSNYNTEMLGWIVALGSCGQLIASMATGIIFGKISKIPIILKSIIALGLGGPFLIGFGFSPVFWVIGYTITLSCLGIINVANQTFWQTNSPANLQGSIFGVRRMISSSIAPIGTLLGGPILQYLSRIEPPLFFTSEYQMIFFISGILIFMIGLYSLSLKSLTTENSIEGLS